MLNLNNKPITHWPWRTMVPGDVFFTDSLEYDRAKLMYLARRENPDAQFWSSVRREGIYIWIPTWENPYPIPRRKDAKPKVEKPVDPVKKRRAERRAWHESNKKPVPFEVPTRPSPNRAGQPKWRRYPFETMAVGDSFVTEDAMNYVSISLCAASYGRLTGKAFQVRRDGDGVRCTRLPNKLSDAGRSRLKPQPQPVVVNPFD